MTLAGAVLVTAVVWTVSLIRAVRFRALVYSLPLPMTLVLASSPVRIDGGQLIGVLLLVGFFAVVWYAHERLGWHILLADAAGVVGYLAAGAAVAAAGTIPFVPVLLLVCLLWWLGQRCFPPPPSGHAPAAVDGVPNSAMPTSGSVPTSESMPAGGSAPVSGSVPAALAKLAAVFTAALLMVGVSGVLRGLVVTFPYSGVLVAVEVRQHLGEFARHFTRGSLALIAFLTGCWLVQDAGRPVALIAGWLAFAATATILHRTGGGRGGNRRWPHARGTT